MDAFNVVKDIVQKAFPDQDLHKMNVRATIMKVQCYSIVYFLF